MNYSVKIEVVTPSDKGKDKKHTEEYLVDALSCTEAEGKILEHFKSAVNFDFSVKSVRETKILEIIK